jgi:mRNA interferase MazF
MPMKKPTATSEAIFNAGDIVVVPFPYADMLAEKRRPALVISNSKFNNKHGLVWVAMITSAENRSWPSDIELPLAKTGLSAPSRIRVAKIATIDVARIVRKAGKIDTKTAESVSKHLDTILA